MADTHKNTCDCETCRSGGGEYAGIVALLGATVAIGAAAAYLFGTESGRRSRAALRRWMADMREDAVKQLQDLQYVDRDTYYEIIDDLVEQYKHSDEVDVAELMSFAREMKDHYHTIRREIEEGKQQAKSAKKKAAPKKSDSSKTSSMKKTTSTRKKAKS